MPDVSDAASMFVTLSVILNMVKHSRVHRCTWRISRIINAFKWHETTKRKPQQELQEPDHGRWNCIVSDARCIWCCEYVCDIICYCQHGQTLSVSSMHLKNLSKNQCFPMTWDNRKKTTTRTAGTRPCQLKLHSEWCQMYLMLRACLWHYLLFLTWSNTVSFIDALEESLESSMLSNDMRQQQENHNKNCRNPTMPVDIA